MDSENLSDEISTLDYQKSRKSRISENAHSHIEEQNDQESLTDTDDSIPFSMLVNGQSKKNDCPADGYENQGADLLSKKMKTGPNTFTVNFQSNSESKNGKKTKPQTKKAQKIQKIQTKFQNNSRKFSLSPQLSCLSQTTREPSMNNIKQEDDDDDNNQNYIDLTDQESDEFNLTNLIRKSHHLHDQAHDYLDQQQQQYEMGNSSNNYQLDSEKEEKNKKDLKQEIVQILKEKKAQLVEKGDDEIKCQPIYSQNEQFQVQCQFGHKFKTSYKALKFTGRKNAGHQMEFDQEENFDLIQEKCNSKNIQSDEIHQNQNHDIHLEKPKKTFQEESDFSCSDMEEEEKQQMMDHKPLFYFVHRKRDFCEQCNQKITEASEYAKKKSGILISTNLEQKLHFKCKRGHDFYLNVKGFNKKWCMQCKKLYKQEIKNFLKQEEMRQQQEYQEQQEELYKKARESYQKQKQQEENLNQENQDQEEEKSQYDSAKIKQAQKEVDIQLEQVARSRAESFFSENKEKINLISNEEAVQVYKMILYPENVLGCYFSVLNKIEIKDFYKKHAQLLHPDKNHHPDSADAFVKLNKFYNTAINKFVE